MKTARLSRSSERGFTLFELVAVIGIITILSAIAIPKYLGYREKAKLASAMEVMRTLQGLAAIYLEDTGFPPSIDKLDNMYRHQGGDSIKDNFGILYVIDENAGHGNDWDGVDQGNPGNSGKNRDEKNTTVDGYTVKYFVIFTKIPFESANYIYGLDDNPPKIAPEGSNPLCLNGR